MYSQQAIEAVELYCRTWPQIFEFLSSNAQNNMCFETMLFPNEVKYLFILEFYDFITFVVPFRLVN